jgi:hypothetical protein
VISVLLTAGANRCLSSVWKSFRINLVRNPFDNERQHILNGRVPWIESPESDATVVYGKSGVKMGLPWPQGRQQKGVTLRPPIKGRIPPINGSTPLALHHWIFLERTEA